MRYNFDLNEANIFSCWRSPTTKEDVKWVPLQNHPVFAPDVNLPDTDFTAKGPSSLLSWDKTNKLYYWDSWKRCIHQICVRLGEPEPGSVLASSSSKDGFYWVPNFLRKQWNTHFTDLEQPEQEYYLQPFQSGRLSNAASLLPVDFSFGGDHLWDMFSVFVLFGDGSIYIICPVVPFGSVFKWEYLIEMYTDAKAFDQKSANPRAINNCNLSISWLESTFPELPNKIEGVVSSIKAAPYVVSNTSLCLQGPLRNVCCEGEDGHLSIRAAECEGHAVSCLYNMISKDSVLVTAWSGGQLQVDALADEIQPGWRWTNDNPPRVRLDSHGNVAGVAMICDSVSDELPVAALGEPHDRTVWLGSAPPLLRLAIVDFALPKKSGSGFAITMFVDPLMPERIYALHDEGAYSVILHFLPFTNQSSGRDDSRRAPSVRPVLSTGLPSPSPIRGFLPLWDSFGYSWIVGVMCNGECVVMEMKTWDLLLPACADVDHVLPSFGEWEETSCYPSMISNELLGGPNVILVPHASPSLRSVAADSIEGRSALHQYFRLFHENYVEYAHKVYFEIMHHRPHVERIVDDLQARLGEAQGKLLKVEKKQVSLDDRISSAIHQQDALEQRLHNMRNLPGVHRKPLSKAEREFQSELDQYAGVELASLRATIGALQGRLRRCAQSSSRGDALNEQGGPASARAAALDPHVLQWKSSIEKLSRLNCDNMKKIHLIESVILGKEQHC